MREPTRIALRIADDPNVVDLYSVARDATGLVGPLELEGDDFTGSGRELSWKCERGHPTGWDHDLKGVHG